MNLEEAIAHYLKIAEENEKDAERFKRIKATQDMISHCYECAEDHRQLAEWLRELNAYKNDNKCKCCKNRGNEEFCDICCWRNINPDYFVLEVNADV